MRWIPFFLVFMASLPMLEAQTRVQRSFTPDGTEVETRVFVEERRIEKRFSDTKGKLFKIAIYNTDADGKSLRSAVYNADGKLRFWERFAYSEDRRLLTEVRVFDPSGGLIMVTTFVAGKPKVVDANGNPMRPEEWKKYR